MGQLGLYGTMKSELGFGDNIQPWLISAIQFEFGKKTLGMAGMVQNFMLRKFSVL